MAKKALIAMSGGVDSSVAAYLMKEAGYDCIGVTMKLYDNEDIGMAREKTCCSLSDIEDARSVCVKLGIPYYVFNFKDDFKEKVIDNFISCYQNGMTPNPCIECNRHLKFEHLYKRAKVLHCDVIVTGHYAKITHDEQGYHLLKGVDDSKDQSYVLYSLTQEQLALKQKSEKSQKNRDFSMPISTIVRTSALFQMEIICHLLKKQLVKRASRETS